MAEPLVSPGQHRATVVNLADFRAARRVASSVRPAPDWLPSIRHAFSARAIAHRQRMLSHLASVRGPR